MNLLSITLRKLLPATSALMLLLPLISRAGPYDGAAGSPGSLAVPMDSTEIQAWATGHASLQRGLAYAADASFGFATFGDPDFALGPATNDPFDVVSLGDGGSVVLTFAQPITNGPGWDFAVFENSFSNGFLELAFVEVSSNGTDFFRFPSVSLTPVDTQIATFGELDPTDVHNLAGKHAGGFGTPFDLDDLIAVNALLNVFSVTHIRLVDVVGSIDPSLGSLDSLGNLINDPFPTPFETGGFDLDAVGVRHLAVPEPSGFGLLAALACLAWTGSRRHR